MIVVDFFKGFCSPSIVQNFIDDAQSEHTQNKQTRKHLRLIKYMQLAAPLLVHHSQHDSAYAICNVKIRWKSNVTYYCYSGRIVDGQTTAMSVGLTILQAYMYVRIVAC